MKTLFQQITVASDGAYPLPATDSNEEILIKQQSEPEACVVNSDEASNATGIADAPRHKDEHWGGFILLGDRHEEQMEHNSVDIEVGGYPSGCIHVEFDGCAITKEMVEQLFAEECPD